MTDAQNTPEPNGRRELTLKDLADKIDELKREITVADTKIDAYQKAANQVTNLAFGLIVTATLSITTAALTIIVPMVVNLLSK